MIKNQEDFDYDSLEAGLYDQILFQEDGKRKPGTRKTGARSFWHFQKFDTVLRLLTKKRDKKILDIGCSAGSFLGMVSEENFGEQVGVDIAQNQIDYAKKYQTPFRQFLKIDDNNSLTQKFSSDYFDAVTLIEVIEHLNHEQIREILSSAAEILKKDGELVITTPNYLSSWPILEQIISYTLKPSYEEQHITKFTFFNFLSKIRKIYPDFDKEFKIEFKSTSHLVSFLIAAFSDNFAQNLSKAIKASNWKMPFGAILMVKIRKL